ncbi:hypothetical protein GRI40_01130 [Altererythrobacter aerius]|uniref:Lipoprotein n=1 Tax=Tsuneonella aeria TaxID=1837929 RepID=A0A6I4TB60_9SPHN|nr:hypothetical protein [Tsuneonella aeria]MXO73826.1 hypothetical protein [Tsuneonella aeria]
MTSRFHAAALSVTLLMLSACAEEEGPSPAEKARMNEAAVAEVKAAQVPPPTPVTPDTIGFADVEQYDLFGAGCNFALADSGTPVALLQPERGYMKIDGKLVPFAPDAGSDVLPLGTRSRYTGAAWSLILDLSSAEGKQSGMETVDYPARFVLRNDRDQIVYQASGIAQCGS